eukprot:TRINITY_DN3597_c0_g1_i4.p1 TRINITY_DN3597_c0_g1~~TRINITY_DN3597_c0_g1_i4.p1  ORF type:complete len:186 (-),score=16.88 TRINITY_DN3597_c0_g1_i4:7-564(-)
MAQQPRNQFLLRNREKEEFNQYWYSAKTIDVLVSEVEENATRAAFLSTPSVFFSLKNQVIKSQSTLFDIDPAFGPRAPGQWIGFDFRDSNTIPAELHHTFDYIVIDPPFITEEVWRLYAHSARLLAAENAKFLITTIAENANLMRELLDVAPCPFQPSIPHLVYQYNLYTNYQSDRLNQINDEVA